jgi:glycosyltransferase involved in cell wall biosynthesis
LAEAIAEAMLDPAKGKSLVPHARARIEENFSLEAGISRTANILMRAIENHAN